MAVTEVNKRNTMRYCVVFLSFIVLYIAAVLWSIRSGSVSITFDEIINIIFKGDETNKVAYNVIDRKSVV